MRTHEGTYDIGLAEAMRSPGGRTLVLFLGSNIGNFDPPDAHAFLKSIRRELHPGDGVLIGADLRKAEADLILAYDDPLGVTAAFNVNLLSRMNRELGADFDLRAYAHRAIWNEEQSRVEMYLVSRRHQRVVIPAAHLEIAFDEGEGIWTESSYKYGRDEMPGRLAAAGFTPGDHWIDEVNGFSLTQAVV